MRQTVPLCRTSRVVATVAIDPQARSVSHQSMLRPAEYAAVGVRIDADGRIESYSGSAGEQASVFPRFVVGARIGETLSRLDFGLAAVVNVALAEQVSLAGSLPVYVGGTEHMVEYRIAPHCGQGWSADVLLHLCSTPAGNKLAESSRRSQSRASTLAEITSLQDQALEPAAAARAFLPLVAKAVAADTGAVLVVRGDDRAEVLSAFGSTRRRGFPYSLVDLDNPCLATVTQRRGVCVKHESGAEGLPAGLLDVCPKKPALIGVFPAFSGHTLRGLLVVGWRKVFDMDSEEMNFLRVASDSLGLSLAYTTLSQQTEMSEVVLDTAGAVARTVSGTLDLEQTFQQIAMSAARVMGDCRCLLLVLDSESDELVVASSSDPSSPGLVGLKVAFGDVADLLNAADALRGIVIDDVEWSALLSPEERKHLEMSSALFMPITAEGALAGALLFYSRDRRDEYSPRDLARAQSVAEQAASAIASAHLFRDLADSQRQTRELLERVTRVRQDQRVELAGRIHDEVVQTMVAALFEAEGLRAQVPGDLGPDVDRVANLLRQAVADARQVIGDLRPPALSNLGLVEALRASAERLSATTPIDISVRLSEEPTLSADVEAALYKIASEALQNAIKHSDASRVFIELSKDRHAPDGLSRIRLRITDDGVGCDSGSLHQPDHFGATLMEEQASMVGGSLSFITTPGQGFTVDAVVPSSTIAGRLDTEISE